jgi:hypothetical protein
MKKRKRTRRTVAVPVQCGACGDQLVLDLPATSSAEERSDASVDSFYVCEDCTPIVEKSERVSEGVDRLLYFQSHLAASVVNFSSDE